jgi:hypothetical protein
MFENIDFAPADSHVVERIGGAGTMNPFSSWKMTSNVVFSQIISSTLNERTK